MTLLLIAFGGSLVVAALIDATATTLAAGGGGGPLTARLARTIWRALLLTPGQGTSPLLSYAGMLTLLATVAGWIVLLWVGWSFIFAADSGAVVSASTRTPASVPATVYYAGFVLFTLGVGDFVPATGPWQVATAVASFIGLFFITLSITYLISVVSAAVSRRRLAQSISVLGQTGPDIVATHWNGQRVSNTFSSRAEALTNQILQTTEQHLAYPVLHYFHSSTPSSSAPRALAALDDALLILSAGISPDATPDAAVLEPLRRTLERYSETVHATGASGVEAPPLPPLGPLRAKGVPVVEEGDFANAAEAHRQRRQSMHALVRSDAWSWPTS